MNETLKKDLCSRIPEKPLMQWVREEDNEIIKMRLTIPDFPFLIRKKAKPILFSIDCLTKEITVNGETFVPIEKMCMDFHRHSKVTQYRVENNSVFTICESKSGESIYVMNDYRKNDFWIIEKLNEWHVNYRLEKDQFIEGTNEYQ